MIKNDEEKAREIANDNCTHICLADCSAESYFSSENDCYKAALQAMQWKDEQFIQEKQQWIEKACEWIKELMIASDNYDAYDIQENLRDFKNAMEE